MRPAAVLNEFSSCSRRATAGLLRSHQCQPGRSGRLVRVVPATAPPSSPTNANTPTQAIVTPDTPGHVRNGNGQVSLQQPPSPQKPTVVGATSQTPAASTNAALCSDSPPSTPGSSVAPTPAGGAGPPSAPGSPSTTAAAQQMANPSSAGQVLTHLPPSPSAAPSASRGAQPSGSTKTAGVNGAAATGPVTGGGGSSGVLGEGGTTPSGAALPNAAGGARLAASGGQQQPQFQAVLSDGALPPSPSATAGATLQGAPGPTTVVAAVQSAASAMPASPTLAPASSHPNGAASPPTPAPMPPPASAAGARPNRSASPSPSSSPAPPLGPSSPSPGSHPMGPSATILPTTPASSGGAPSSAAAAQTSPNPSVPVATAAAAPASSGAPPAASPHSQSTAAPPGSPGGPSAATQGVLLAVAPGVAATSAASQGAVPVAPSPPGSPAAGPQPQSPAQSPAGGSAPAASTVGAPGPASGTSHPTPQQPSAGPSSSPGGNANPTPFTTNTTAVGTGATAASSNPGTATTAANPSTSSGTTANPSSTSSSTTTASSSPTAPISSVSSGFQLRPIHVVIFAAIFLGGALFAALTLQFTADLDFQAAATTVARRVTRSVAFRQLCVIACAICLVRFGLNNVLRALAKFSASPVQWDKSKVYYILKEVYQPLELLLFIAAICTIADSFVPQLIAVPRSTVSTVVRSTLSVSFIIGAATVVFNLKSRFCKENAWQSEMNGDVTAQRRWEAYDKLGTFVIYTITFVLGIQALGLEVTSVLAIGGIGGLAIGLAGREICENILNGFLIMSTSPFEVGDEVHFFHSNKVVEGMVMDIGWYRTTIRSYEREVFVIPNAVFSKNIVLNITRKNREWRFFEMICVRVQDVHKTNAIIQDIRRIVRNDQRIITKLHRRIFLDKVTHDDCRIYVSFYVEAQNRESFMAAKQDLLLAFVDCVERNGAKLAVPRTTVQMEPEMAEALSPLFGAAAAMAAAKVTMEVQQAAGNVAAARALTAGRTITAEVTAVPSVSSSGSGAAAAAGGTTATNAKAAAAGAGGGSGGSAGSPGKAGGTAATAGAGSSSPRGSEPAAVAGAADQAAGSGTVAATGAGGAGAAAAASGQGSSKGEEAAAGAVVSVNGAAGAGPGAPVGGPSSSSVIVPLVDTSGADVGTTTVATVVTRYSNPQPKPPSLSAAAAAPTTPPAAAASSGQSASSSTSASSTMAAPPTASTSAVSTVAAVATAAMPSSSSSSISSSAAGSSAVVSQYTNSGTASSFSSSLDVDYESDVDMEDLMGYGDEESNWRRRGVGGGGEDDDGIVIIASFDDLDASQQQAPSTPPVGGAAAATGSGSPGNGARASAVAAVAAGGHSASSTAAP